MKYIKKFNTAEEVVMYDPFNLVLVADTDTVLYDVPAIGIWVQHINGDLYSADDWVVNGFSNEEANGVALIDAKVAFVIAKSDTINDNWSDNDNTLIEGVSVFTNKNDALSDYSGLANTEAMLKVDKSGVFNLCNKYVFPNGKNGYLPALGEYHLMYENLDKINAAMAVIGGTEVNANYWSSTQYDAPCAWRYMIGYNGQVERDYEKYRNYYCGRPCAPIK
jgi:hypothetical protein